MKRCRVVLCGVGGNMGKIRTHLVYGNPRFEIRGVCDVDVDAAQRMADLYSVRFVIVMKTKLVCCVCVRFCE
jgi:predicted dehydrogenase